MTTSVQSIPKEGAALASSLLAAHLSVDARRQPLGGGEARPQALALHVSSGQAPGLLVEPALSNFCSSSGCTACHFPTAPSEASALASVSAATPSLPVRKSLFSRLAGRAPRSSARLAATLVSGPGGSSALLRPQTPHRRFPHTTAAAFPSSSRTIVNNTHT